MTHVCRTLCGVMASLLALSMARADDPPKKPNRTLDPAKLPPGTVIVISDKPSDAFRNVDAIVLSPDEYKKLLEAAEQGRKPPDKPDVPSVCRLSGRIETQGGREVALLTAEYRFRTTKPKSAVAIGLPKCKPTAATLDGQLAAFDRPNEDSGFAALADAPGDHASDRIRGVGYLAR